MRVVCRHGHFALYPVDQTEAQRFMRVFQLGLYPEEDYFTLEGLVGLPRWSQIGRDFGGIPAIANYEGQTPWETMRANGYVYSLALGVLIPVATVTEKATLPQTLDCRISPKPILQAGAFIEPGVKLLSYWGELDMDYQRLYIYATETDP